MDSQAQNPATALVDAYGQPVTRCVKDRRCPHCGAGPEKRVASAGFGEPHPVCGTCGYEFLREAMQ